MTAFYEQLLEPYFPAVRVPWSWTCSRCATERSRALPGCRVKHRCYQIHSEAVRLGGLGLSFRSSVYGRIT